MNSLSQQITDHLKQCDRIDDSELLLEMAREEIERLNAELAATLEREDLERSHRNAIEKALSGNAKS